MQAPSVPNRSAFIRGPEEAVAASTSQKCAHWITRRSSGPQPSVVAGRNSASWASSASCPSSANCSIGGGTCCPTSSKRTHRAAVPAYQVPGGPAASTRAPARCAAKQYETRQPSRRRPKPRPPSRRRLRGPRSHSPGCGATSALLESEDAPNQWARRVPRIQSRRGQSIAAP